ncbi:UNVERIFIED_CONTAM: hypothetical protein Slati_1108800 [Sesamum latifolium]|uniref:Uncharacterized protein n=1 Tax=Sesamum latifolium TaxID=2727402 RepID=A0AAW2XES7_9LAMI
MGIGLGGFDLKKAKGRGAGCWMRKNDEEESAAANALSTPIASLGEGKGNGKMVRQSKIYT